jgi:cobalamin biosynthesis protein CobT
VTEDDEDGDDGESDKQQLTEKQKRELREKENAKAAKKSVRDEARKKASEARAARAASDAQVIPTNEFEMSKTGLTIPSNGIEFVPPDHLDTFSDRPTVSDKKKCCQKFVCLSLRVHTCFFLCFFSM